MVSDLASLSGLAPVVAVVALLGGVIIYGVKSNNEAHKEKGEAFLDESRRKDQVLSDLTKRAFDSMDKNTEVLQKLIAAIQVNTDATRRVSETLDEMRLEIAGKQ